ncbi:MAG: sensor histidine kinase [Saprospiraceae bacterium]
MSLSTLGTDPNKSKNPTPQQIAFFAAAVSAVFTAVLCLLLAFFGQMPYWAVVLCTAVTLVVGYVVFLQYLRRYIYRKIKLVYKTIHQHKLTPEEKTNSVNVREDIIEQVEEDVSTWIQEQNLQIAELKRFDEYRQRFLGDISHELKTPIFNVQGYLETLLDGALEDDKVRRRYIEKAAKNVERLNTIVEDLESISRLENGKEVLDMQVFGILDLVNEVFDELEMKAKLKGITLSIKQGAASNFNVLADRENIRQVLINLVNNSIKYGKENGASKIAFYDMDKNILVEVADDGIGIREEHMLRIFERFYRIDKSRSRQAGGSGLGLSIVKHIIEAHEQTINVRSSSELGSTFGFTLAKS